MRDIHSLQRCTTSPEPKRHSIEQNLSLDSACCKTRMGIKWTVATPFFMCTELHTLPTKGCTRHLQHLCSQPCSDGDRSTYGTPEMPIHQEPFLRVSPDLFLSSCLSLHTLPVELPEERQLQKGQSAA